MIWAMLMGAIFLEIAGTTSMKMSEGFTRLTPSVLIFVFYGASFTLLTLVLKRLDVSVVYPIWSGVGTLIVAMIGVWWFGESMTWLKAISIGLIVIGVIGLNVPTGQA